MPSKSRQKDNQGELGQQVTTLAQLSGGYNGYTNPELLSPQNWVQAAQIYSGQFGSVRRARFAPVVNASTAGYTPQGGRFTSLFNYRNATPQDILLGDNNDVNGHNGAMWSFNVNGNYAATLLTDGVLGISKSNFFVGPWSRYGIGGIVYGMNVQIKRQFSGVNLATITNWGLDTPDAAPTLEVEDFGPNPGSTAADQTGTGLVAWTNPNNIFTTGGSYATATLTPTGLLGTTDKIYVKGFGFALPSTAQITGFSVQFKFQNPLPTSPAIQVAARLLKAGVEVGVFQIPEIPAGATSFTVGDQNNLWGTSGLVFSDVNASTFGVSLSFNVSGSFPAAVNLAVNSVAMNAFSLAGGPGNITKIIGRSYTFAWENATIGHVSAPSPATNFIPETLQSNLIDCIETGTATAAVGSNVVTLIGTTPNPAWVARHIWIAGIGDAGLIQQVSGNTVLLSVDSPGNATAQDFQIFDTQSTNIRLYATGDGQPVYFRIQRNAFNPASTTLAGSGLQFLDNDNSEPPDGEFTSEIEQLYNIPPPIGTYVAQYQARLEVFGVAGAPQSFFYSNFENTTVGLPWDSFSSLNQVTMPMGNAQLRGVAGLPTGQILWSSAQDMFKLTGLLSDNVVSTDAALGATIQQLPYKIGCASAYAIVVTSLGAIWLSSDREVWLFTDHYAPKNIGQPVQDILNTINGARMKFARMVYYKQGEKNWVELSIATGTSTFNNVKLILDIDLLSSNGQASFFTFDMATNQPTWYIYNVDCESDEVDVDANSIWHSLSGGLDVILETDYHGGYFTIGSEQLMPGAGFTTHALGNEAPEVIKSLSWTRCNTNQLPKNIASQGWKWAINVYDDDKYVMGVQANVLTLIPASDSILATIGLEASPALFKFGGVRYAVGRRFQFQTIFPATPGDWEFRSFQVGYENVVPR